VTFIYTAKYELAGKHEMVRHLTACRIMTLCKLLKKWIYATCWKRNILRKT